MDIIHLLPDNVANQIAAGEVIQRPASCLKELVENSLDAGAGHITVIVRDAGRTLLQVIDDGNGMSETDARMAFERHATSKISEAQDLFSLRTMGFRGEALASVCAVAQVELQTRRAEDEVGTLLEIAGSNVIRQEQCQCPVGTNIRVKNLFFNVPARRKFLKTDQTELRNLIQEFYHIVLVYPKVQFTFVSNDEILIELAAGTEKQRIESVFGKGNNKYTGQFVDLSNDTDIVSIRGFIGKPEQAGKNAQQYFFVNGRYMRHSYFHKAVMTAYAGMLPGDYNPSYFIYFEVRPEAIDVNIHPTKTEIKFADEQAIFQILMASVRESLGKFNLTPSLDFNREGEIEIPTQISVRPNVGETSGPRVVFDPNYNPFHTTYQRQTPNLAATYPSYSVNKPLEQPTETTLFPSDLSGCTPLQYAGKYILVATEAGLAIVNQHRAHACVHYYQLIEQMQHQQGVSQQLLFPDVLDLNASDMLLMENILPELRSVGFDLEQLSKSSYSVCGVPALLNSQNAIAILQDILHIVRETGMSARDKWQENIAWTLAKAAAIPYGKSLNTDEMRDLIDQLINLPSYRLTPNGKKVVTLLTDDEINKRF